MATASPPPSEQAPSPPPADSLIAARVAAAQAALWRSELTRAALLLVLSVIGAILVWAVLDQWIWAAGPWLRLTLWIALLGWILYWTWQRIVPLFQAQIDAAYAARSIERDIPEMKHALSSYVSLLDQRETSGLRGVVVRSIGSRAAGRLRHHQGELPSEVASSFQLWIVVAGAFALLAAYTVFSPKDTLDSAGRLLLPLSSIEAPSRVRILEVQPGDVEILANETVRVEARLQGLREGDQPHVRWEVSGETRRIPLQALDREAPSQFTASLDGSAGSDGPHHYTVIAGDARSRRFQITPRDVPVVQIKSVEYEPLPYTGRPPRTTRAAAIEALEGTEVTLHATTNRPIAEARIELNPRTTGGRTTATAGVFPMEIDSSGTQLTTSIRLRRGADQPGVVPHSSYRLRVQDADGAKNPEPVVYPIKVLPDLAPEVTVATPVRTPKEVPLDAQQLIEVHALDPDFGLTRIVLRMERGTQRLPDVRLWKADPGERGTQIALYRFRPQELDLQRGDVVNIRAVVEDNRHHPTTQKRAPNRTVSDPVELRITAPADLNQSRPSEDGLSATDEQPVVEPPQEETGSESSAGEASSEGSGGSGGGSGGESGEQGEAGGEGSSGKSDGQEKGESQGEGAGSSGGSGDASQTGDSGGENSRGGESGGGDSGGGDSAGGDSSGGESAGGDSSGQGGAPAGSPGSSSPSPTDTPPAGTSPADTSDRPNGGSSGDPAAAEGSGGAGEPAAEGGTGSSPAAAGGRQDQGKPSASEMTSDGEAAGSTPANGDPAASPEPNGGADTQGGEAGQGAENGAREGAQPNGSNATSSGQNSEGSAGSSPPRPAAPPEHDGEAFERIKEFLDQQQSQEGSQPGSAGNEGGAGQEGAGQNAAGPEGSGQAESNSPRPGEGGNEQPSSRDNPASPRDASGAGEASDASSRDAATGSEAGKASSAAAQDPADAASDAGAEAGSNEAMGGEPQPTSDGEAGKGSNETSENETSAGKGSSGDETGDGAADGQSGEASDANEGGQMGKPGTPAGEQGAGGETGTAADSATRQDGDPADESAAPRTQDPTAEGRAAPANAANGDSLDNPANEPGSPSPDPAAATTGQGGATDAGGDRDAFIDSQQAPEPVDVDYAKKATDMVLDYLEETGDQPDPELLERLNWSEADLQRFRARWENARQMEQRGPRGEQAFEETLRSLGMRDQSSGSGASERGSADQLRDLRDSGTRRPPPSLYRDAFDAFRRSLAE